MENKLSHINEQGHARMVNVTDKVQTVRTAIAKGEIYMAPETLDLIQQGGMPKGDVLAVSQVAANHKRATMFFSLYFIFGLYPSCSIGEESAVITEGKIS